MIGAGVLHRFEDWREEISNAVSLSNKLATGHGVFSVGISQARSIALSSSSNIIVHKPFKKSI
jgi:hypothetical protein